MKNIDEKVVEEFGLEWERFDQNSVAQHELKEIFDKYFHIFPFEEINERSMGFDIGCGSGRWAQFVAPLVGKLHLVDPSIKALSVAKRKLVGSNCEFHNYGVDDLPFDDNTMDFGYSLGVLHHIPDTFRGICSCVEKLKPGAPFLIYLYYRFDNQPLWYRLLWEVSDLFRKFISNLPYRLKLLCSQVIALLIYYPMAKLSKLFNDYMNVNTKSWPLSEYGDKSFYTMRTDALDRFGTRLEQRFTQEEIRQMMQQAGLQDIKFYDGAPYWCAVGTKEII